MQLTLASLNRSKRELDNKFSITGEILGTYTGLSPRLRDYHERHQWYCSERKANEGFDKAQLCGLGNTKQVLPYQNSNLRVTPKMELGDK